MRRPIVNASMSEALLSGLCFGCGGVRVWGLSCHFCGLCVKYKERAQGAVRRAVVAGKLPKVRGGRLPCVDCRRVRAHCYDHRNYGKPLQVAPVCHSCNLSRGPGAIPDDVAAFHRSINEEIAKLKKITDKRVHQVLKAAEKQA